MTTNSEEVHPSLEAMHDRDGQVMTGTTESPDDKSDNINGTSVDNGDGLTGEGDGKDVKDNDRNEHQDLQQSGMDRDGNKTDNNMSVGTDETTNTKAKQVLLDDELSDPCLDFMSDPAGMSLEIREKTFALGEELQKKGKDILALKCYLRCLSGLNGKRNFPHISQCLRNVAELYYSMEEYDKAVQFIQAEKVYYESELIDSSGIFQLTEEKSTSSVTADKQDPDAMTGDPDKGNLDVIRAQEYATLAQLCLDHEQPLMALEYQAKATKLRQKLLGNDHPVTQKSLNAFTIMYAEAGKKQYSESLKKYVEIGQATSNTEQSGLRQRKKVTLVDKIGKEMKPDQDYSSGTSDDPEDIEIVIPSFLYLIIGILCSVIVIGTIYYLYCRDVAGVDTCLTGKKLTHYYNRLSYMVNQLTKFLWNWQ